MIELMFPQTVSNILDYDGIKAAAKKYVEDIFVQITESFGNNLVLQSMDEEHFAEVAGHVTGDPKTTLEELLDYINTSNTYHEFEFVNELTTAFPEGVEYKAFEVTGWQFPNADFPPFSEPDRSYNYDGTPRYGASDDVWMENAFGEEGIHNLMMSRFRGNYFDPDDYESITWYKTSGRRASWGNEETWMTTGGFGKPATIHINVDEARTVIEKNGLSSVENWLGTVSNKLPINLYIEINDQLRTYDSDDDVAGLAGSTEGYPMAFPYEEEEGFCTNDPDWDPMPTVSAGGSITSGNAVTINAGSTSTGWRIGSTGQPFVYESTKSYGAYRATVDAGAGDIDPTVFALVDSSGELAVKNISASSVTVKVIYVSVCSSSDATVITVYDSNNNPYNAFKYTLYGTDYYYVLDGIQTDWTDDLESIGYHLTVPLPTVSMSYAYPNQLWNYSVNIGAGASSVLRDQNGNALSYDSTKSYSALNYYTSTSDSSGTIDTNVSIGASGSFLALFNNGSSQITVQRVNVATCADSTSTVITVYDSSNNPYNAFKYTSDGTDYYYVLDGTQTDWTDDLGSIGYSLPLPNVEEYVTGALGEIASGSYKSTNLSYDSTKVYMFAGRDDNVSFVYRDVTCWEIFGNTGTAMVRNLTSNNIYVNGSGMVATDKTYVTAINVYNSNNVAYPCFKFNGGGQVKYWVWDGSHQYWTDDLASIGYNTSLPNEVVLKVKWGDMVNVPAGYTVSEVRTFVGYAFPSYSLKGSQALIVAYPGKDEYFDNITDHNLLYYGMNNAAPASWPVIEVFQGYSSSYSSGPYMNGTRFTVGRSTDSASWPTQTRNSNGVDATAGNYSVYMEGITNTTTYSKINSGYPVRYLWFTWDDSSNSSVWHKSPEAFKVPQSLWSFSNGTFSWLGNSEDTSSLAWYYKHDWELFEWSEFDGVWFYVHCIKVE